MSTDTFVSELVASHSEPRPYSTLGDEFQPFDLHNPFPFYDRARLEEPIFYNPELGYWVVSRFDDVHAIFKDHETFSAEIAQSPYKPFPPEAQEVFDAGGFTAVSGLSARVPPDHTRLRAFVNKAFTPQRIRKMQPRVRELAIRLIEGFRHRGRVDIVQELYFEFPAFVIFMLLGVPDEDVQSVKNWAGSRLLLTWGHLSVEEQVKHAHNMVKYWNYCKQLVEKRFVQVTDDLVSDLARIYQEGDQSITQHEIASICYSQLTAGHETTTGLMSQGTLNLLTHRDQWEALVKDPAQIPNAVEEVLRFGPPIFTWRRKVKRPVTIGGVDLPEGANLLLLLGSANRDENRFQDGNSLDVSRQDAREHLSFGLGIHYCLGAPLARQEAIILLEELTRRLPSLRLVEGQPIEYLPNTSFRGPRHLLVEWDVE